MNRGIITISESSSITMPTTPIWMTMQEIADMLNVFGCYVRKAINAIFKEGVLREFDVRRHVKKNNLISYDVYNLELIIAAAFRIDSIESRVFREFIMQAIIKSRPTARSWFAYGQRVQWHRTAIKQRFLEALRLQPLGRTTAVF